MMKAESSVLNAFLPATRDWFMREYGQPTAPQALGWPAIQRGEHTLILSPTGSGKTMTAFLWGIDSLFRELADAPDMEATRVLYVSPLKALNNDIDRNLRVPLRGIRKAWRDRDGNPPRVRTAVRTGDTPQSARRRMISHPPHILITTPESLYLILTSPVARNVLRTVRTVILDEIHTLVGTKRGVHLTLSLERLAALTTEGFQRIGLSATQRPLEEVARFLGGQSWVDDSGYPELVQRPVTIVDAGITKPMDLEVITAPPDLRKLPGGSIWPTVIPSVLGDVLRHRTTLVFTNSRRAAERAADRLNEQFAQEQSEEVPPGSTEALVEDGVAIARGIFGTGRVGGPFKAHHGSVSRDIRHKLENELKEGKLPALIGTSSLELGIDIGAVDLVVQLQSPHGVARGLQRIGRSGHLVGQTSKGRIYATFPEDLLDAAAVAHGMAAADIEPTFTPQNCLDVLAQHFVAMVSVQDCSAAQAFALVRQAYGYRDLSQGAFDAVLDMLSGRYKSQVYRDLKPRLMWDQTAGMLRALPGSRILALNNAGTITSRGLFRVYAADGKTQLGTLDEEFVHETYPGDVFSLGTGVWRVTDIDENRVLVTGAAGAMPRMPFWHGEKPRRDYFAGCQLGALRRRLKERLVEQTCVPESPTDPWPDELGPVLDWLSADYFMDEHSAKNATVYVGHQVAACGDISSDEVVLVERFADALGEQRMVIHSCFGARVNAAWAMALSHAMRERYRIEIETQVNDDGILFRLVGGDHDLPMDIVAEMPADEARQRILLELPDSALFGSQFRMNAERALLLPRARAGKRTPFWLQRLRSRDLYAATRQMADFPLIAETYRDCLSDVLDMSHLAELLERINSGEVRVRQIESVVPTPVAASLLFDFTEHHMYEGDMPRIERQMRMLSLNRELLGELVDDGSLGEILRPQVIQDVDDDLQFLSEQSRARNREELAYIMQVLGDLSTSEVLARSGQDGASWLDELAGTGRVVLLKCSSVTSRWVDVQMLDVYRRALANSPDHREAVEQIVRGYARNHAPFTAEDLCARYSWQATDSATALDSLVHEGVLVSGRLVPGGDSVQFCDRRVLERLHRQTLAVLRRQVEPVSLETYGQFLQVWQGLTGEVASDDLFEQLSALPLPLEVWVRDVLLARGIENPAGVINERLGRGSNIWIGSGNPDGRLDIAFVPRSGWELLAQPPRALEELLPDSVAALDLLAGKGPVFFDEMLAITGLSASQLRRVMIDLIYAGRMTGDRIEALTGLVWRQKQDVGKSGTLGSSLDRDLAAWRSQNQSRRPVGTRPSAQRLSAARRSVRQRISAQLDRVEGRWWLLNYGDVSLDDRAEALAWQLLDRYGVFCRPMLGREAADWPRSDVYLMLHRLELMGRARRGYLVSEMGGVQYALPDALELLRDSEVPKGLVCLNACDPASLVGLSLADGTRPERGIESDLSRVPSNYAVYLSGTAVLTYEHGSGRWRAADVDQSIIDKAIHMMLDVLLRAGGLCAETHRVKVSYWGDERPIGLAIEKHLGVLGFRRDAVEMVFER